MNPPLNPDEVRKQILAAHTDKIQREREIQDELETYLNLGQTGHDSLACIRWDEMHIAELMQLVPPESW